MAILEIKKREAGKDLQKMRSEGILPAVVYGAKTESSPISVNSIAFEKVLKEAGESTLVSLKGDGFEHDVLIHDVVFDAITDKPVHVDFYAIEKGQKVKVHVELIFEGVSNAVKTLGGNLIKVLHEVEVEAEPKNLPHNLIVDISTLVDFESKILAKDLKLPAGVELITEAEEVLALVQAAREQEAEEPVEAFDPTKVEVAADKKKDEEGADAGAAGAKPKAEAK